jgi:hypothetical protein
MGATTQTPLPTILLIPGALQSSACYDRLRPLLKEFPVVVGSLTSLNPTEPEGLLLTSIAMQINHAHPRLQIAQHPKMEDICSRVPPYHSNLEW